MIDFHDNSTFRPLCPGRFTTTLILLCASLTAPTRGRCQEPDTSLTVYPSDVSLVGQGESRQLLVSLQSGSGESRDATRSAEYRVMDGAAVSISSAGVVTALAIGIGYIPANTSANVTVERLAALREIEEPLVNPQITVGGRTVRTTGTLPPYGTPYPTAVPHRVSNSGAPCSRSAQPPSDGHTLLRRQFSSPVRRPGRWHLHFL